jgi:hypothetical protein
MVKGINLPEITPVLFKCWYFLLLFLRSRDLKGEGIS